MRELAWGLPKEDCQKKKGLPERSSNGSLRVQCGHWKCTGCGGTARVVGFPVGTSLGEDAYGRVNPGHLRPVSSTARLQRRHLRKTELCPEHLAPGLTRGVGKAADEEGRPLTPMAPVPHSRDPHPRLLGLNQALAQRGGKFGIWLLF